MSKPEARVGSSKQIRLGSAKSGVPDDSYNGNSTAANENFRITKSARGSQTNLWASRSGKVFGKLDLAGPDDRGDNVRKSPQMLTAPPQQGKVFFVASPGRDKDGKLHSARVTAEKKFFGGE